ncbi:hypothetical protein ACTA71_003747 [Dictyostelium dimigraforme]
MVMKPLLSPFNTIFNRCSDEKHGSAEGIIAAIRNTGVAVTKSKTPTLPPASSNSSGNGSSPVIYFNSYFNYLFTELPFSFQFLCLWFIGVPYVNTLLFVSYQASKEYTIREIASVLKGK